MRPRHSNHLIWLGKFKQIKVQREIIPEEKKWITKYGVLSQRSDLSLSSAGLRKLFGRSIACRATNQHCRPATSAASSVMLPASPPVATLCASPVIYSGSKLSTRKKRGRRSTAAERQATGETEDDLPG
jgi:hypothetical protein